MNIDKETNLSVLEDDWWEGISTNDVCSVLEIKDHSILITNGVVRREIPRAMVPGDFRVVRQ